MTAQEAKELVLICQNSAHNSIIKEIDGIIEDRAKTGSMYAYYSNYLSDDIIKNLENRGFLVKHQRDLFGGGMYTISWY